MALPYPIASTQTDAKSPVDDNLMDSIRLDLDYLNAQISLGGQSSFCWSINGPLASLVNGVAKRIDMQFLHSLQTFTRVRIAQEKSGSSGATEIDIRHHTTPKTPVTGIDFQFSDSTTSIALQGATIATQAIAAATPGISTQEIIRAKASLSIQSIINISGTSWRYNLSAAPDSDYKVGDSVLIAGCASGGNNGTFLIAEVNHSGYPSIKVTNASGVAQTTPSGSLDLQLWAYNFINPVNSSFVAGEVVNLSGHTNALNNGAKTIYSINQLGNNILVKNPTGVAQAGVIGAAACTRWVLTYTTTPPARFVVGEKARFSGHTSGANNGDFLIVGLNLLGDNIVISNASGVAQGAAAGTAAALRWKYSFAGDPATSVLVGDSLVMAGHTTGANNGIFKVVDINDTTANNIIIYNALGVAQASTPGTVKSTRKLVKFSSDQSLIYSLSSYIELNDCQDVTYNLKDYELPFKVLQINRGGGANYNLVIDAPTGGAQASPAGFVAIEARSIFTGDDGSKPQVTADLVGATPNGVLTSTSTAFVGAPIPAQSYLGLYILKIQAGEPTNLSVILS